MGFIFLFLLIIIAGHTYVFWHIWCILPLSYVWKTIIISLCAISFLSLFLYLSPVMDKLNMVIARIIYEISTSWLIILLYLIILFLLMDIGRLCHFIPSRLLHSSIPGSLAVFLLLLCYTIIVKYRKMRY